MKEFSEWDLTRLSYLKLLSENPDFTQIEKEFYNMMLEFNMLNVLNKDSSDKKIREILEKIEKEEK